MEVRVQQGSLTDGAERVLVNASNTNAELGSGVSGAIRRACGKGYQEHIQKELHARFGGPMPPGEVLITDAGKHPTARYVAHVAVMDYRQGFTGASYPDAARIRQGCENLWRALDQLPDESLTVAMVALGAGTGQLGLADSIELACETLKAAKPSRVKTVVFYGYTLPEFMNTLEVVSRHFELDLTEYPEDVRAFVEQLRATR